MFDHIISLENLCLAWKEFVRGKKYKKDVAEFSSNLSQNLFKLYQELENKTYKHGEYESFQINDPKLRTIHKASVRDRLLHHAVHRVLCSYFERFFIYDSYSNRKFKGTHRAVNKFRAIFRKASKSNSRTCWVLKCDIRKFFDSVDHQILMNIFIKYIFDINVCKLVNEIVESFCSFEKGKGLPLGNLTSQLLSNIYMNEFDQHIKHTLKVKYYIRYADDFVILSDDKKYLINLVPKIDYFLADKLGLHLHPNKVFIKTFSSGVDFLGWISFSDHRILRTSTKRRMLKKLKITNNSQVINSYLGLMKHGNANTLRARIIHFVVPRAINTV